MKTTRTAARLTILFTWLHLLVFALLHFLEPQLSPASNIISDYMQTGNAWLALPAFYIFALIWLSLGIALAAVPQNWPLVLGRILFMLAFLSILLATVFPASMDPRTGTFLSNS